MRTFLRVFAAAVLGCVLSTATFGQGTGGGDNSFEPLNPFEPGANLLGLTDEAPMVSYNEFNGDVTIGLPVGVSGLGVPVQWSRDGLRQLQHYGLGADEEVGALGRSWHVGYGFIQANRPYSDTGHTTCLDNQVCSRGVGWTALVEPSGHVTDFHRDYLFQRLPDDSAPVLDESHWIDSRLRRITRDPSQPFSSGPYVLLGVDGTRTVYEPVYDVTGSSHDSMRFYPTSIEEPTGRVTTLTYRDPTAPAGTVTPFYQAPPAGPIDYRRLLHEITDSWGRSLRFEYYSAAEMASQLGAGADPDLVAFPRLREVVLEHAGATASLGTFDYTLVELPWGSLTRQSVQLARFTTPGGYATRFAYRGFAESSLDNGIPLLDWVDLPTGGRVDLDYQRFDEHECQPAPPGTGNYGTIFGSSHLRLRSLAHSGETYTYAYAQGTGLDPADGPDGEVRVELETASGRYDRTTIYKSRQVDEIVGGLCTAQFDDSTKLANQRIGRPLSRVERYRDRDGVETEREETWSYLTALLSSNTQTQQIARDDGALYATVIERYSQRVDGVWLDTDFTYDFHPGVDDGLYYQTGHPDMGSGDFHFPVTATRGARGATEHLAQEATYQHRGVFDHTQSTAIDGFEHALGLRTSITADYHHPDATSERLGKSVWVFRLDSERRTLLDLQRQYRASDDYLETRYAYYDEGTVEEGMVRLESRGFGPEAASIEFDDYAFGVAQSVTPAIGPATTRTVSFDGTLADETVGGIVTEHDYDADFRRVESRIPGSGEWSHWVAYSAPLDPPSVESFRGFTTTDRNQSSLDQQDAWGRTTANRTVVDSSPYVEATAATSFGPIGMVDTVTSVTGATTTNTWDVQGREVTSRTLDTQGTEIAFLRRFFSTLPSGHRRVEEHQKVRESDSEEVRRVSVVDLAGRTVYASTNDDLYQQSLDHRDGGFTTVEYRADTIDGVERSRQILAPYGSPQRTRWTDWLGNLVRASDPESGTTDTTYDSRGRLASEVTAGGRRVELVYDAADRPIERRDCTAPGPCRTLEQLGYDPTNGRRASATTFAGVETVDQFHPVTQRTTLRTQRVPGLALGPVGLAPTGQTPTGSVALSWTPIAGAQFYQVEAERGETVLWQHNHRTTASVTLPASVWDGLSDLTWRVRALDGDYAPTAWSEAVLEPEVLMPRIAVTPAAHDFGQVTVGDTATITFTVSNPGSLPAVGSLLALPSGAFALVGDGAYDLQPGESDEVTVAFSPTSASLSSALIDFRVEGGDRVLVELDGAGATPPETTYVITPGSHDFGAVELGAMVEQSFTAEHTAGPATTLQLTGVEPPFLVTSGGGSPLTVGGTTSFTVRFEPSTGGVFTETAVLVAADGSTRDVVLVGEVASSGDGDLLVPPAGTGLDFGVVTVGGSRPLDTVLRNVGSGVLDAVTVSFSDPAFAMGQGWPCPPLDFNEACRPEIVFTPSSAGVVVGQATFRQVRADGTVNTQVATLTGEGYQPGALVVETGGQAITELDLGQIPLDETTYLTFELRNTNPPNGGTQTSTFASGTAPAPFSGSVAANLAAGEVDTVGFQITPNTAGPIVRTVRIDSTTTPDAVFSLRAEVVTADVISVDPGTVVFSPAPVGSTATFNVQITNLRNADHTLQFSGGGDFASFSDIAFGLVEHEVVTYTVRVTVPRVGPLAGEICFTAETSAIDPVSEVECLPAYGEGTPALTVTDAALDLGVVPVGQLATGSTTLGKQILQAVSGQLQVAAPFALASGATTEGFVLAAGPGGSASLDVRLAPAQAGDWTGSLRITADTGEEHRVALSGRTVTPDLIGAASTDFGLVLLDSASTVVVPIANPTEVELRAQVDVPAPFSAPATLVVAAGATVDLPITLAPTASGSLVGQVALHHAPASGDLGFDQLLHSLEVRAVVVDDTFDEAWPSAVFDSAPDPLTGRELVQLTTTPGENYALYVHDRAQDASGRFLVYRNLLNGSPSTLTYYRLDLETGATVALVPTGLANGGTVRGEHLYTMRRVSATDPYSAIHRTHVATGVDGLVVQVPGTLGANLDVADDESVVLYTYLGPAPGGGQQQVVASHRLGDPSDGSLDATLVTDPTAWSLLHLRISPADPSAFTLRRSTVGGLGSILLGDLGSGSVVALSEGDPLLGRYASVGETFWDADGGLWLSLFDGVDAALDPDVFARLVVDAGGVATVDESVDVDGDSWQAMVGAGRASGWLVGAGSSQYNGGAGRPAIQLVRLPSDGDPATRGVLERHELASSLGADGEPGGHRLANPHLLESLDGVVFTAPYDLADGAIGDGFTRHVFLVRLPDWMRRALADATVRGTAEGPFVHANRLVTAGDWQIDFGAPDGFGDGVADVVAPLPDSPFAATHEAFGDLDGDGLDDRILMRQETGGWRAYAWPTDADGSFDDGAPTAERFWAIDAVRPPLFGDLDGDGFDDLVLVVDDGQVASLRWQVYRNPGHTLPRAVPSALIDEAYLGDPVLHEAVFFEDVDGDGFADRVVANPATHGGWTWRVDRSTAGALGDAAIDSRFDGGVYGTDVPLVADVDGDGRADVVIARRGGAALRWYVNPTAASGALGSAWSWNGFFGDPTGTPHLVHLGRFTTRH